MQTAFRLYRGYQENNYIGVTELNIPGGSSDYGGASGMLYDSDAPVERAKIMMDIVDDQINIQIVAIKKKDNGEFVITQIFSIHSFFLLSIKKDDLKELIINFFISSLGRYNAA